MEELSQRTFSVASLQCIPTVYTDWMWGVENGTDGGGRANLTGDSVGSAYAFLQGAHHLSFQCLSHLHSTHYFVLKIIKPWEVTDFSVTGARERRLIQKSKQPKWNLISTAEFYAVNG